MSKFLVVMKREYAQVVKKKSFLIMTLLTPVLMAGFMILPSLLVNTDVNSTEPVAIVDRSNLEVGATLADALGEYRIDESDVPTYSIELMSDIWPQDDSRFQDIIDSLTGLVDEREIKYVLSIGPEPHLHDSSLLLITNSDDFRTIRHFQYELSQILSKERLASSQVNLPVDSVLSLTRNVSVSKQNTSGESIPFEIKFFAALVFVMLMYMVTIINGSGLMRSIIEEKNSRIVEVLVSSVTPFELLAGKIVGAGAAALTQVAIWVGAGVVVALVTSSSGIEIDPSLAKIVFNPVVVTFFVLFFVTGYLMFCTLFALVGSMVNSDKEAQNFLFPIIIWMLPSLMVGMAVIRDPYATWVLVLSYIPLCTPTMMFERVVFLAPSATEYSLFSGIVAEATLGLISVIISTIGITWLSARIFRVGILMYGKRPTLPEIIKWIKRG
jgi:ABC-2 type transport system permease protein